jgi:hypothetical protein
MRKKLGATEQLSVSRGRKDGTAPPKEGSEKYKGKPEAEAPDRATSHPAKRLSLGRP